MDGTYQPASSSCMYRTPEKSQNISSCSLASKNAYICAGFDVVCCGLDNLLHAAFDGTPIRRDLVRVSHILQPFQTNINRSGGRAAPGLTVLERPSSPSSPCAARVSCDRCRVVSVPAPKQPRHTGKSEQKKERTSVVDAHLECHNSN
jgi:hypothetical protein